MDLENRSRLAIHLIRVIRRFSALRWLGHVATPYTLVLALKEGGPGGRTGR
jgi:hypothetical protein